MDPNFVFVLHMKIFQKKDNLEKIRNKKLQVSSVLGIYNFGVQWNFWEGNFVHFFVSNVTYRDICVA